LKSPKLEIIIQIASFEQFEIYLNNRNTPYTNNFVTLQWGNERKAALVELIYSLFEAKTFGNATIRAITDALSVVCGLELSHQEVNQTWQEIKGRKKVKDIFLQKLSKCFHQRLQSQDE